LRTFFYDFEIFKNKSNIYTLNTVDLRQSIWTKLLGWPRGIKTDYSVNSFTIFDFLMGIIFLPSSTDPTIRKEVQFKNDFWSMSLLDEFCLLIENKNILLKYKTKKSTRKLFSSKSYFNSIKSRETFIKLIGDDMSGTITRHGGIPSHIFTEEAFISKACGKQFYDKFNKKKFTRRYGKTTARKDPRALIGLYDQSQFTCRFRTGMTRWHFLNEYIPDQKKFFELSKNNNYDKKLFFRDPERSFNPYLKNFPGAIIDNNKDIRTSLAEFGLLVITYDSSLPLFLINNDIPFFLFWRKEHWPFWDKKMYGFLTGSGLYHESPETLNESMINYFQYGQNDWKKKYSLAATEYKNFLRSVYVENY